MNKSILNYNDRVHSIFIKGDVKKHYINSLIDKPNNIFLSIPEKINNIINESKNSIYDDNFKEIYNQKKRSIELHREFRNNVPSFSTINKIVNKDYKPIGHLEHELYKHINDVDDEMILLLSLNK
jgi:hypothetical protein